jgi:phospholipase/carboxylesterase
MSQIVSRQIANLDCSVIEGTAPKKAIIFLHGFGADKSDLVPLADMISRAKDTTWIFPNGIMEVIVGPGFSGRAWFTIDMDRLERAMRNGQHEDFSHKRPPGLDQARERVMKLYNEVRSKYETVILGGFSQGAMLATEITLRAPKKPDGLVIMSGVLIDRDNWIKLAKDSPAVRYIQSHGKNDAILGFSQAEALNEALVDAGWDGEFISFSGGHEIPPKVIEKIGRFV